MQYVKKALWGKVLAILVMAFFALNMSILSAYAQEEAAAGEPAAEVSTEVKAEVEQEIEVSAEVQAELSVNLNEELGMPDYDAAVPTDGLIGRIITPIRAVARDAQEGIYGLVASDSAQAELLEDHAKKELLEAAEVYADDPKESDTVVGMLEEYQEDLGEVQEVLPAVKEENPELAKELSEDIASEHMFEAPKVLSTIHDGMLAVDPEAAPKLVNIKKAVIASAADTVLQTADNETEAAEILKRVAEEKERTPFSGMLQAEILSTARDRLGDKLDDKFAGAMDEAISSRLDGVEEKLKSLEGTNEEKAEKFKRFMTQVPGLGLERMKMADQFRGKADLPPVMLQKMQEVKVKVAEAIGQRIKGIVEDEVRKAMREAMLDFRPGDIEGMKMLGEFETMVPDEEIRREIAQKREEQTQKFLDKFGDDQNARAVTGEFQQLMRRVENREILPDAGFFNTLAQLKDRLSPEQRHFISELENSGKQQMAERMQNDDRFAERFATFNPADLQVYQEKFNEGFGPDFGPPPGFDFQAKFQAIERKQAENFGRFLELQDAPEDVAAIKQQFENVVPAEIRERFEERYEFNDEKFAESQDRAQEKERFFKEKFEQMQKEFDAKFGGGGPAGTDGRRGFIPPGPVNPGFAPDFGQQFFNPAQRGEFPGRGATQGQFPGQENNSGGVNRQEIERKVQQENPGLNEQERKVFIEREVKQQQQQPRTFPGQGATGGQFPGQSQNSPFPSLNKEGSRGEFQPPQGNFGIPGTRDGSVQGGGAPAPSGSGAAPSGGGLAPGGGSSAPAPSGGGAAPAAPAPGPVSFDPLGAIGSVLGLFIRN